MKAKYKLDQFIKFNNSATASYGAITGVIKRNEGFSYEVESHEGEVAEKDVISAFRAVASRKPQAKKQVAKKAAQKKPVASAPDQDREAA
jgi:hypothetical protein